MDDMIPTSGRVEVERFVCPASPEFSEIVTPKEVAVTLFVADAEGCVRESDA